MSSGLFENLMRDTFYINRKLVVDIKLCGYIMQELVVTTRAAVAFHDSWDIYSDFFTFIIFVAFIYQQISI